MNIRIRRFIQHRLAAYSGPDHSFWRRRESACLTAQTLVRIFYIALLFLLILQHRAWPQWASARHLDAQWSVAWFESLGIRGPVIFTILLSLTSVSLCCFRPEHRYLRIAAAIGVWLEGSLFNSFGSGMHGWHVWIWTAVLLCLAPSWRPTQSISRVDREAILQTFWAVQLMTLMFYSLSGAFKLAAGFHQLWLDEYGLFHPEALSRHIAFRVLEGMAHRPLFGDLAIAYPFVFYIAYLFGVYLEAGSLLVAFRPVLHRLWGMLLIAMHLGILVTMGIEFTWQILFIGIVLVASPFTPPGTTLTFAIAQMPGIRSLKSIASRKSTR